MMMLKMKMMLTMLLMISMYTRTKHSHTPLVVQAQHTSVHLHRLERITLGLFCKLLCTQYIDHQPT